MENSREISDRALLAASAQADGLTHLSLLGLPCITVRGLTSFVSCTSLVNLELADLFALNGGSHDVSPRNSSCLVYHIAMQFISVLSRLVVGDIRSDSIL